MFQLALCEDDPIFYDTQSKACRTILEKLNVEHQIHIFSNSADFITAFITQQQRFDMILLDIVMNGVDGMELARQIRHFDEDAAIVFISSYDKFAIQGYDVKALHYLMKPVDTQLLENLIKSVYAEKFLNDVLIIKSGEHHIRVPIKEIVCLEIVKTKRRVEITLMDRSVFYSGKLLDILNELPKGQFIRCYQSCAVNVRNIREINRRNAIAVNGKEIPISRTFRNEIKTAFLMQLEAD